MFRTIGRKYFKQIVQEKTGCIVWFGPFKGLKYVDSATGSQYSPKLIGTYERELHPQVEEIIEMKPNLMINVGAGEGYYAAGLAMRLPELKVIAYEAGEDGQASMKEIAELNGVQDHIDIRGLCDPEALQADIPENGTCVVICDVEGYEDTLLNLHAVPALSRCYILVELHDMFVEDIEKTIAERFAETHEITTTRQDGRSSDEYPFHSFLTRLWSDPVVRYALYERRYNLDMAWHWMKPRNKD